MKEKSKSLSKFDFLSNRFSWAVVIRADINTIEEVKQFIADKDITVVFQKISAGKLYIKEGEP